MKSNKGTEDGVLTVNSEYDYHHILFTVTRRDQTKILILKNIMTPNIQTHQKRLFSQEHAIIPWYYITYNVNDTRTERDNQIFPICKRLL